MKILTIALLMPTLLFAMQPGVINRSLTQIPADTKRIILAHLLDEKPLSKEALHELLKRVRLFITANKTFQSQLDDNPKVIKDILEEMHLCMDTNRQSVAAYLNTHGTRTWYSQLPQEVTSGYFNQYKH